MGLIILTVIFLLILVEIGKNSKDYNFTEYQKDLTKEYSKWRLKGLNDDVARANAIKKVQKNKKDGKYNK